MLIASAVSEIARNIVEYTKGGEVILSVIHNRSRLGLQVIARDQGPGIADLSLAMKDGYSTSRSLGLGLPGSRRLMDEFRVESTLGFGYNRDHEEVASVIQTFTRSLALLDYGVASFTAPNQNESGDRHLVKTIPGGTLLAVVDGAGHGPEAAIAAQTAIGVLKAHATDEPASLVRHCHEQLRATRGAVMSLAVINCTENTLTWLGIGNIEGVLLYSGSSAGVRCESMLVRPGIVGYRLPLLQPTVLPISAGDLIILATDGIRPDFGPHFGEDQPRAIAEYISSRCRTGLDDGLVLVARYQGTGE